MAIKDKDDGVKRKASNSKSRRNPISLADVLVAIRIHMVFIVVVLAIGLVGMELYLQSVRTIYQSEATIRIKQARSMTASQLDPDGLRGGVDSVVLTTYMDILKGRGVIEPVLGDLEYDIDGKHVRPSYEAVAAAIGTVPVKGSQLVKITYNSEVPAAAQAGNQIILDAFMNRLAEMDRKLGEDTSRLIADRTKEAQQNLNKAEDALNAYQKATKNINADSAVNGVASKLQNIDNNRANNLINLSTAEAQLAAVRQQQAEILEPMAESPLINSIKNKLIDKELERTDMLGKWTEEHPQVLDISAEIADLNAQLNDEIQRVVNDKYANRNSTYQGLISTELQTQVKITIAKANLAEIDKLEKQYRADVDRLTDEQRTFLRLKRDVTVTQDVYMMLAKRLEEARVSEVSVVRDVFMVEDPTFPKAPISSNKMRMRGIAALVALLLGVGIAVAQERFRKAIYTAQDVDKYLGIPVLGQIPEYSSMERLKGQRDAIKNESKMKSTLMKPWRTLWK